MPLSAQTRALWDRLRKVHRKLDKLYREVYNAGLDPDAEECRACGGPVERWIIQTDDDGPFCLDCGGGRPRRGRRQ